MTSASATKMMMNRVYQAPSLYLDVLRQAHTLVAGQTGSGKSVLLNGLITTAMKQGGNQYIFVDPKQMELWKYHDLPNCIAYAETPEQTVGALDKAIKTMEKRNAECKARGIKMYDGEPIYIFIDELADLLISPQSKTIKAQLQRITGLARASNIHLIACTQQPSRKMLPCELSLNFPARIALHCQTAIESRQIINVDGAERLPLWGECLYLRPSHDLERWRVPYTEEAETDQVIADLKGDYAPLIRIA